MKSIVVCGFRITAYKLLSGWYIMPSVYFQPHAGCQHQSCIYGDWLCFGIEVRWGRNGYRINAGAI
jgi:hypothetical protein